MRKFKFINPVILTPCLVPAILPLTMLVGCNKSNSDTSLTSLMTEYNPTEEPAPATYFVNCFNPNDVVNKYFDSINDLTRYFKQDLLYTLTRSVQNYNKLLQDNGVTINSNKFEAKITNVSLTRTLDDVAVNFDLQLNISFKYSCNNWEDVMGNKFNILYKQWDSKGKYHFTLDFDTRNFSQYLGYSKISQLLVNENVANFGINELKTSFTILEESGTKTGYKDGSPQENWNHDYDPSGHGTYHFVQPNQQYWSKYEEESDYNQRLNEIKQLKDFGYAIIANIFNYYNKSTNNSESEVPNTISFGSYHSKNASLVDTFEFTNDNENTSCYGFNYSNNAQTNATKLVQEQGCYDTNTNTFTLPTTKLSPTQQPVTINTIAKNAFNANVPDRGEAAALPQIVEKLVIPGETKLIDDNAFVFKSNNNIKTIEFKPTTSVGTPCIINNNAFAHFNSLMQLDFHNFNATYINKLLTAGSLKEGSMANIHEGFVEDLDIDKRGHIYLNSELSSDSTTRDKFIAALKTAGLNIPADPLTEPGWIIDFGEPENL